MRWTATGLFGAYLVYHQGQGLGVLCYQPPALPCLRFRACPKQAQLPGPPHRPSKVSHTHRMGHTVRMEQPHLPWAAPMAFNSEEGHLSPRALHPQVAIEQGQILAQPMPGQTLAQPECTVTCCHIQAALSELTKRTKIGLRHRHSHTCIHSQHLRECVGSQLLEHTAWQSSRCSMSRCPRAGARSRY